MHILDANDQILSRWLNAYLTPYLTPYLSPYLTSCLTLSSWLNENARLFWWATHRRSCLTLSAAAGHATTSRTLSFRMAASALSAKGEHDERARAALAALQAVQRKLEETSRSHEEEVQALREGSQAREGEFRKVIARLEAKQAAQQEALFWTSKKPAKSSSARS